MKNLFLLLLLSLILFGCFKPDSDFNLKKYEYSQGDALVYENLSQYNKNSKWEIVNMNGEVVQVFKGTNPNLVTGINLPDGVYTLKLMSYRWREKKASVNQKQFLLKSIKHELRINGNNNSSDKEKEFTIYVDNQLVGYSKLNGYFKTDIPEGLRYVRLVSATQAKEGLYDFNNNVSINFNK